MGRVNFLTEKQCYISIGLPQLIQLKAPQDYNHMVLNIDWKAESEMRNYEDKWDTCNASEDAIASENTYKGKLSEKTRESNRS